MKLHAFKETYGDGVHGHDERSVKTSRLRKSISVERTYAQDIEEEPQILLALEPLLHELRDRFARISDQYRPSKRFIKVKFNDFEQTTIEEIIGATGEHWLDVDAFSRLLAAAWRRGCKPVRLLGAGLRLAPGTAQNNAQLELLQR